MLFQKYIKKKKKKESYLDQLGQSLLQDTSGSCPRERLGQNGLRYSLRLFRPNAPSRLYG